MVSRRTESGQSVDSLSHLSHLLAADNVNYESSDAEYEKTSVTGGADDADSLTAASTFTHISAVITQVSVGKYPEYFWKFSASSEVTNKQ